MSEKKIIHAIAVAFLFMAVMSACDPPNFAWPERIPDIKAPDVDGPTSFDRWKAERMKEKDPVLIAGAAVVDLTPKNPTGTYIAGYMPNKRARGIGGPITGRILFLDDGRHSLVMVSFDFVGFANDSVWDLRRRISTKHREDIFVASTHNHAGPDTIGMWGPWAFYAIPTGSGADMGYMSRILRDTADGVLSAVESARPARLFSARIEIPEGISENAHKPGWKDNTMTVLQVRGEDGATIATVVNYACHAEFLGGMNSMIHPDFPGYLYPEIEKREGGTALFFNGALGGIIVPAMPRRTENSVHLRDLGARRAGRVLGAFTSKALLDAEALEITSINVRRRLLPLPVENEFFRYLQEKGIVKFVQREDRIYTEVWRIDLGGLQMVGVPGEIFPSLGFAIKDLMPSKYKMVIGLANDELGYIMNAEEWLDPMYDYEKTVSVGPETGPRLMDAVKALYSGRRNEKEK